MSKLQRHGLYALAVLLFSAALAFGATRTTAPAKKLQVVYREDNVNGVWNVYVFGTECTGGRLELHQPTDASEPLRIECVEHR